MLIAHLPAGYLLTRRIVPRLAGKSSNASEIRRLTGLGLLGSVLPDFDLLYFYLVDGRQTLHHQYWTHVPAFWVVAVAVLAALLRLARVAVPWPALGVLLANVYLHLGLDTLAGGIAWLYPYDPTLIVLARVPARFDWWVWSFVFHWTFLVELAILGVAARQLRLSRAMRRTGGTDVLTRAAPRPSRPSELR